jgi:methionine synthase II (cobalamin-independent)
VVTTTEDLLRTAQRPTGRALARGVPRLEGLRAGTATGIGSLPHRSAGDAARFALAEYDIPAIPTLPRKNPAEGMIAQAVVGINGVTSGQYGSLAVDASAVNVHATVITDLTLPHFQSLRRFLRLAVTSEYSGPLKWQFVGPVTLGVALTRAGLADDIAFQVAARAVRSHVAAISVAITTAMPSSPQVIFIDEPWFGELLNPGFPIDPDTAIDLLSGAMAAVSGVATVGVHCCGEADVPSLLAAGPDILSIPVTPRIAGVAGYLGHFLDAGGRIAWGVVPTDGPMFASPDRHWRELLELWGSLSDRGVDFDLLRSRSLVTPHCGLGTHTPVVADRVCRAVREVGRRIADLSPRNVLA